MRIYQLLKCIVFCLLLTTIGFCYIVLSQFRSFEMVDPMMKLKIFRVIQENYPSDYTEKLTYQSTFLDIFDEIQRHQILETSKNAKFTALEVHSDENFYEVDHKFESPNYEITDENEGTFKNYGVEYSDVNSKDEIPRNYEATASFRLENDRSEINQQSLEEPNSFTSFTVDESSKEDLPPFIPDPTKRLPPAQPTITSTFSLSANIFQEQPQDLSKTRIPSFHGSLSSSRPRSSEPTVQQIQAEPRQPFQFENDMFVKKPQITEPRKLAVLEEPVIPDRQIEIRNPIEFEDDVFIKKSPDSEPTATTLSPVTTTQASIPQTPSRKTAKGTFRPWDQGLPTENRNHCPFYKYANFDTGDYSSITPYYNLRRDHFIVNNSPFGQGRI